MNPRITAAAVAALAVATSRPALALGAIVSAPAGASSAFAVHEAVSAGAGRTVRWGSVEVRGTASTLAWLVPVRPGAALDLASDAWLEALEAASAPRVVPPDIDPPCGIPGGVEVEAQFTHAVTTPPGTTVVAANRAALDAALATYGLAVTSDLAPPIDAAFAADSWVVGLVYTQVPADMVTRTVRVVDTSPAGFSLSLVEAGASPVSITAFAFGTGSVAVGVVSPITMDPSAVVWKSDGTSTYGSVRNSVLAANPGAWLFETGGNGVLFQGLPVPGGNPTPALSTSYYFRAAGYADATSDPDACNEDANAIAQSDSIVAPACPAGSLAHPGDGATCQEIIGAGELDPSTLRCGGIADDLAMALSGLAPAQTWLTRVRGSLAPTTLGQDVGVTAATAAGAYGPVVTASGYAESCTAPGSSSGSTQSGGSSGTGGGSSGGGGNEGNGGHGSSGDPGGGAANGVALGVTTAADVANAASDSSDGCGGDSSDSSDSCGGDSSSSDDSSGGGCDGSSDDSGSCNVSPHRHTHASRLGLALVALAAFARRRDRSGRR